MPENFFKINRNPAPENLAPDFFAGLFADRIICRIRKTDPVRQTSQSGIRSVIRQFLNRICRIIFPVFSLPFSTIDVEIFVEIFNFLGKKV